MGRVFKMAGDEGIRIESDDDIQDAIGLCDDGAGLLLTEDDVSARFFDLRTGLAEATVRALVDGGIRAVIVVEDPDDYSDRFAELAAAHAKHPQVRFARSRVEAEDWLGE